MKLIDLYCKWAEDGRLPEPGICSTLKRDRLLPLFIPTKKELKELRNNDMPVGFWASGKKFSEIKSVGRDFTPLRQNIVLFICAMKGEL